MSAEWDKDGLVDELKAEARVKRIKIETEENDFDPALTDIRFHLSDYFSTTVTLSDASLDELMVVLKARRKGGTR